MAKRATKTSTPDPAPAPAPSARMTRGGTMIELMRGDAGATVSELAGAVGWQAHSVRGFLSGTLKKRIDLKVVTTREDGVTRYRVIEPDGGQ